MSRLPSKQAAAIIADGIPFGPRTHPCVCGAGRHAHAGKNLTGACKATGCTRYRSNPAYDLAYAALDAQQMPLGHALREFDRRDRDAKRKAHPRGPGEWSLGPSDAGTCRRRILYRNLPPEDYTPAIVDQREARMGSIIHKEVLRELAVLYPWRSFEQEVRVKGLDRPAYYDSFDEIVCEVEDEKTAGDWRWDQVNDHGVEDDVWKQVMLYGLALTEAGHTVKTLRVNYIKRCNGHDQTFVRDYDHEAALEARDELLAIASALDMVAASEPGDVDIDELLPRDRSGPSTDALCKRCEARVHCWGLIEAEANGRSGESWTVLGPEPVDEEVEWAIEQNVLAKDAYREAETIKNQTAALVEGLDEGRYGRFKIDTQRFGSGPDYKGFVEQVQQIATLPPEARPDLADIPVPHRPGVIRPVTRRVPKSVLEREERAAARQAKRDTAEGGAA